MAAPDLAYFVPKDPSSGEEAQYNRRPTCSGCFAFTTRTFTWKWCFTDGYTPTVWPGVRPTIDGVPVGPYVEPTKNEYVFTVTTTDGNHEFGAEFDPADGVPFGVVVLRKGFIVNSTGAPLANPGPIVVDVTRFERLYNTIALNTARITYPGNGQVVPPTIALKARPAISANGVLQPMSEQWCVRTTHQSDAAMWRRFALTPQGDVCIQPDNKYFYSEAVTHDENPHMTLRDGPRNFGTLGFISKWVDSPAQTGIYFSDTNGRLGFFGNDGKVTTIAGKRMKGDRLPLHAGFREKNLAKWNECWEVVGDWSRVPGVKRFVEVWGFEGLDTSSTGHAGLHEFVVADTFNNRLIYVDHWTAHEPDHYHKAIYPPPGYTPPDTPTGQATVVVALQGPSQFVNEPWDVVRVGDKLYWSNFADGSICRANLDCSSPERVWWPAHYPTNAEIGVAKRLASSGGTLGQVGTVRANYSKNGGPGVGNLVRPEGMDVDHAGRYLIIGSRYDFRLYELDLQTLNLRILCDLTSNTGTESNNDISVSIDRAGWLGPVDSIYVGQWNASSDLHFNRDGTRAFGPTGSTNSNYNGRILTPNGQRYGFSGRRDLLDSPPNYAWNCGITPRGLIQAGSAGGYQCLWRTKKLPTDVVPNETIYRAGRDAYRASGAALFMGPHGQGELGYRTFDEMGAWTDAQIAAYMGQWIPSASMVNFIAYLRYVTADNDYAGTPPPETVPLLVPTSIQATEI